MSTPSTSRPPQVERFLAWERACTVRLHRRLSSPEWCAVLAAVSRVSNGWIWFTLMIALALSGPDGRHAATHMLLAGSFAAIVYKILKACTGRPRPCRRLADVRLLVAPLDEFSFPSGHALHAVTFSVIAMAYYPSLGIGLVPFTMLVAISRVALGLHYPSDVAAGAAIGWIIALGSFQFL